MNRLAIPMVRVKESELALPLGWVWSAMASLVRHGSGFVQAGVQGQRAGPYLQQHPRAAPGPLSPLSDLTATGPESQHVRPFPPGNTKCPLPRVLLPVEVERWAALTILFTFGLPLPSVCTSESTGEGPSGALSVLKSSSLAHADCQGIP
ncbi:hypothetical protein CB1_000296001 [Camelus ferus]|nr:hypothetical protein CB1_000296001 [Camelus ferus]